MRFTNRFPFTTLNDINLDWIIKQVKTIAGQLSAKQDAPTSAGTVGQVLGLDAELNPIWLDQTGGGTTDYSLLINKPSINSVTLTGNKTASDLGLATETALSDLSNDVDRAFDEIDTKAPIISPTFTGSPAAPTPAAGDDSTKIATTAFVSDAAEYAAEQVQKRLVNPNLLDNWYFVKGSDTTGDYGVFPVNQRGQTSYTGAIYGIDRWKGSSAGAGASLLSDYIQLSNSGSSRLTFIQVLKKNYSFWIGKKLTGTVLLSNNILVTGTLTVPNDASDSGTTYYNFAESNGCTPRLVVGNANTFSFGIGVSATSTINVIAAKLELGDVQTLVHQENDVWILNEIPDYSEQLQKCEAYYLACNSTGNIVQNYAGTLRTNGESGRFFIPTPVSMRKTGPTVNFTAAVSVATASGTTQISSPTVGSSGNLVLLNGVIIHVDFGGVSAGTQWTFANLGTLGFTISCEP